MTHPNMTAWDKTRLHEEDLALTKEHFNKVHSLLLEVNQSLWASQEQCFIQSQEIYCLKAENEKLKAKVTEKEQVIKYLERLQD